MNPQLAFLICAVCVCVALVIDARRRPMSPALWIPTIWAARVATRPFEDWFHPGNESLLAQADGSPLDRNILIALMLAAAVVLARRSLPWSQWRREYAWIGLFFLFCGISVLWSDFAAIGLRRWIRAIGTMMMILVVASERDPVAATAAIVRRCAIVLLPFSVILMKYFREWGVYYDFWDGQELIRGVTTDKNALGRLAMICGLFLLWEMLGKNRNQHVPNDRLYRFVTVSLLTVAIFLLSISKSKTALVCLIVGSFVMLAVGRPFVRGHAKHLGTVLLLVAGLAFLLEAVFDVSTHVLRALGRDPTLTTRTFIWDDLLAIGTNPIIGVGYDTFWLGSRLEWFVENHMVSSAHNGYLETYLETGLVGLLLLAGIVMAIFAKLKTMLAENIDYARLLAAVLAVFLLYNWTESSNKPTTFVCFTLLLVAMAAPQRQGDAIQSTASVPEPVGADRRRLKAAPRARAAGMAAATQRFFGHNDARMRRPQTNYRR